MSPLRDLARSELTRPAPAAARAIAAAALARWGDAACCILFYGSRRRDGGSDGLLDVYVLTDDYRRVHRRRVAAAFNRLLPPNVLLLSAPFEGGVVRAKVAVMSRAAFRRRLRPGSLDTTLWTRFCQPASLLHARDAEVAEWAAGAMEDAMRAAAYWSGRLAGPDAPPEERWSALFAETYRLEIRPEAAGRGDLVYRAAKSWFDAVSAVVDTKPPRGGSPSWKVRKAVGKPLNILRLAKAAFTFDGGADYLSEKLGRHTGIAVVPTDWQRRHPLLGAPGLLLAHRRKQRGA